MITYSKEDHMNYVEKRMYRLCVMSGLSYETVTKENYQEISDALGFLSARQFFNAQAELRSLYLDKYLIPFFDEVQ